MALGININRTKTQIGTDNLFSSQAERDLIAKERIEEIPVESIDAYSTSYGEHPYTVENDNDMKALIESVAINGILETTIVRLMPTGRYQMLSGHRRLYAAIQNNIKTIPAVVKTMTDEEATIAMVDCNLRREHIKPSVKAKAMQMRQEAIKKIGRPAKDTQDRISNTANKEYRSRDVVAEEYGVSGEQVRRTIKLNDLIPELMELLDEGIIKTTIGYELAFLKPDIQMEVYRQMTDNESGISLSQAQELRKIHTQKGVEKIIKKPKANQKPKYHIPCKDLDGIMPKDVKDVRKYIIEAVKFYEENKPKN